MKKNRLLNVQQAGKLLNVSPRTIYRLVADGQFVVLKVKGSLRITDYSLNEYINRQISKYALENGIQCDRS